MSKYNEKALNAAEDAVIEAGCHHLTDRAIATAVFNSLERAPWWEQVDADYEFQDGQHYRCEFTDGVSAEGRGFGSMSLDPRHKVFRDTRWQPPVKPLKVGDLIETVEQAASLPIGTITVTDGNTAFRKVGVNEWRQVTNLRTVPLADIHVADDGDRIIYLPSGDSA